MLPVPLLVPAHWLVSAALILVAFACLLLEGGRLRSSLGTQKRSCQLGLPVSVVALEVVKKAPKGKLPMSLSWL